MKASLCISCQSPKAPLNCGICEGAICKYCAHIFDDETFSFLPHKPSHLCHTTYCNVCFNEKVSDELDQYNRTMELAKAVHIFDHTQGKETRLMKRRVEDKITVENCIDPDEAVLRLAFFAVQKNFNAVINVEVSSDKVKDGSYSKRIWRATGIPSYFRSDTVVKDKSLRHWPN
ncbi:MAG: hypothetical protein AABY64_03925 [Bdellovibrionota bacterium]